MVSNLSRAKSCRDDELRTVRWGPEPCSKAELPCIEEPGDWSGKSSMAMSVEDCTREMSRRAKGNIGVTVEFRPTAFRVPADA